MNIEDIKSAIEARKAEVALYEFNAENFARAMAKLPAEWTDEARRIKESGAQSEEEALLLGRHEFREELRLRRIEELVQRQRAKIILDALTEALP